MIITTFELESASRIADVVRTVEGQPAPGRGLSFDVAQTSQAKKIFRVGSFVGAWDKGDSHEVTLLNVTSTPNTVTAINLLANIPDPGEGEDLACVIAKDGTAWYYGDGTAV